MDQKIDTPRAQSGTVAVLIPCYNEAVTIGKVVDDFRRVLPEATVYVYDNNSSDGTASIAAEHGAVVRADWRASALPEQRPTIHFRTRMFSPKPGHMKLPCASWRNQLTVKMRGACSIWWPMRSQWLK